MEAGSVSTLLRRRRTISEEATGLKEHILPLNGKQLVDEKV